MGSKVLRRVLYVAAFVVSAIVACAPPPAATCGSNETQCDDGSCVNLDTDVDNCGACGNVCRDDFACIHGTCSPACARGETPCADSCVDLAQDPQHCGGCGVACASSQTCVAGKCTSPSVDAGLDAPVDAPVDSGPACTPGIVIAEVFAQGGSANVANDYVVLHNRNASAVSLAGMSLQTINGGGAGDWSVIALTGSIPAHGFYLVGFASGGSGNALPTPDATSSIDMQETSLRLAVVASTTALTGATPGPWTDAVAVGDTPAVEGTNPLTTPDAQALRRKSDRCADTNVNTDDFETATPAPANTSTTAASCTCP